MHALAFAAVGVLLLAAAAALPLDAPPLSLLSCPFRAATGLPCLGCGCMHAFHFAVRGQLGAAFSSNPIGALLALACGAHAIWTALRFAGAPPLPVFGLPRRARWAGAVALAANWIFVIVRNGP